MRETWVWSLVGRSPGEGKGHPLQCSGWRIPWPAWNCDHGAARVRRAWVTLTFSFGLWQPDREAVVSHYSFSLHFSLYKKSQESYVQEAFVFHSPCSVCCISAINSARWLVFCLLTLEVLYLLDKLAPYDMSSNILIHLVICLFSLFLFLFVIQNFFQIFLCKRWGKDFLSMTPKAWSIKEKKMIDWT